MPRNRSCGSYGPGPLMHWIQAKKSHEDAQPIIKVKVVAVHDDGRAGIEGHNLELTLWYHDPDPAFGVSGWAPNLRPAIMLYDSRGSFSSPRWTG